MIAKEKAKAEAIARLREWVKPGDTIFTKLCHVSRSGMFRIIQLIKIEDGQPRYLGYNAAEAMGDRYDNRREGIAVGGCGMDMGFHLVYNLSATLFPDGFTCLGRRCPSSDHSNGDRKYRRHHHGDGGYALNHRWL